MLMSKVILFFFLYQPCIQIRIIEVNYQEVDDAIAVFYYVTHELNVTSFVSKIYSEDHIHLHVFRQLRSLMCYEAAV